MDNREASTQNTAPRPMERKVYRTMADGTPLYRVKLVGGPSDNTESLCSHDTVISNGETYKRGPDNRYYHEPKAGGRS